MYIYSVPPDSCLSQALSTSARIMFPRTEQHIICCVAFSTPPPPPPPPSQYPHNIPDTLPRDSLISFYSIKNNHYHPFLCRTFLKPFKVFSILCIATMGSFTHLNDSDRAHPSNYIDLICEGSLPVCFCLPDYSRVIRQSHQHIA